jgi:hypothetical protein
MTKPEVRTFTTDVEVRGDGRTLVGTIVPYGVEARIGSYVEEFAPGAFADADPERVPLLAAHRRDELPVGRALAFRETPTGLQAELRVSATQAGDDVLTLVRDGAATGLSVGFIPGEDAWSPDRTRVTRTRATLVEVSVVAMPAYAAARITAVRAEGDEDSDEDGEVETPKVKLNLARRRAA